jgi:protocatechuate 3,4-dioxygenase beta subunit
MLNRALTRRQALGSASLAGAALVGGGALPRLFGRLGPARALAATACTTLTPTMTEGPYWVDLDLHRSDVTANTAAATASPGVAQAGVPLTLTISVLNAQDGCAALNGVHVDIWHANAYGLYSDEASQMAGGGSGSDTTGQNYLRGYQVTGTDSGVDGQVVFHTIWPGWYTGRAIHIHVRVRTYDSSGAVVTNYTTQIFFTDAANDTVLESAAPYNTRSPQDDPTTDESDSVYTGAASDAAGNVVSVTGSVAAGYAAAFTVMLDGGTASTGSGSTALHASLGAVRVRRTSHGARHVTARVTTNEAVTVRSRVHRGDRSLGGARGHLRKGEHPISVVIGREAAAGHATLALVLADAHGHHRTLTHRVYVPSRG